MTPKTFVATLGALVIVSMPLTASAGETPRGVWLKLKCAVCHGEDGAATTTAGKQKKARDLRTEDVQKLKDEELLKPVLEGHAGMPALMARIPKEQTTMLVSYIRALAPKKK